MSESSSEREARLEAALDRLSRDRRDERAWTELYDILWPYVFGIVFRVSNGDPETARDLGQEVFLRLVRFCPFDKIPTTGHLRAYVAMTARHCAVERPPTREAVSAPGAPQSAASASEQAQQRFIQRWLLREAISCLAPADRVLAEHLLEGRSLREIARALGVSLGTAAVRAFRVRKRLRRLLGL